MRFKMETPPGLNGTAEQQLRQMYSYLFRLSESLSVALESVANGSYASASMQSGVSGNDGDGGEKSNLGSAYNELRALIVNTADIINSEMDVLRTELNSDYEAISSQWGTFQESIDTTIEATAKEVVQAFNYDARLETLESDAAGFSEYQVKTEGYIKSGFIDYDEAGVPIIGIAIGQGLTSVKVNIDGEEYDQFDASQSCAFYTAEKVSFRINGQEVAYVSNSKLYIGDVEIFGTAIIGDWMISTSNGFAIKWIGG